jgi:hypothetical protein
MPRFTNGGIVGKAVTVPTSNAATGKWSGPDLQIYRQQNIWPLPTIVSTNLALHLDASLSASYPGSGSTWFDLSGNGRNGTLVNSPTFNTSPSRITLNGSNQNVDLGTWFNLNTFTISLWVKSNSSSQQDYADIMDNNHTGTQNFVLQMDGSTQNSYGFAVIGSSSSSGTGSFVLTVGTWVNLVFTFSSGVTRFYRDGQLISTGATATPNWVSPNFRLGRWNSGGRYWAGDYAQVLVYTVALSAEEVARNFGATRSRFNI